MQVWGLGSTTIKAFSLEEAPTFGRGSSLSMDNETKKLIRTLGTVSTVGLAMAISIGIGALLGHFLDKKFGTAPWLFLIFIGFGVAAAFRNLYIMYKKIKDI